MAQIALLHSVGGALVVNRDDFSHAEEYTEAMQAPAGVHAKLVYRSGQAINVKETPAEILAAFD